MTINHHGTCMVKNEIIQGSVAGHLLFLIHINDLDKGMIYLISRFISDLKLTYFVKSIEGYGKCQNDFKKNFLDLKMADELQQ